MSCAGLILREVIAFAKAGAQMKNGCSKLLDLSVLIVCLLAVALMYFFLALIDGTPNIFENADSLIMFCTVLAYSL